MPDTPGMRYSESPDSSDETDPGIRRTSYPAWVIQQSAVSSVCDARCAAETVELLAQLAVRVRVIVQIDAGNGCLPRLADRGDAGAGTRRMRHDRAAGHVEHVDPLCAAIGSRRLQTCLTGADDRQDRVAA